MAAVVADQLTGTITRSALASDTDLTFFCNLSFTVTKCYTPTL